MIDALVIGAGPAGLMAAEELAKAGKKVCIVEAKPSAGRKFLMAGKSGLNLTKDEPMDQFLGRFDGITPVLEPVLKEFGPSAVQEWAQELGQEIFTGSTGRVFPVAMKSSPLLRAWLARLGRDGVELRANWRWIGWDDDAFVFQTPEGKQTISPKVTVLALGGASWSRLGSDGKWAAFLEGRNVKITPFAPSNAGLVVDWSSHMERHFGAPVKGVALRTKGTQERGEFVVSKHGLEGGGIYSVSKAVRQKQTLMLDLLPDVSEPEVLTRLSKRRGKSTITNHLRKVLKLSPVKLALLMEFGRPLPQGGDLASLIKSLPIKHAGFRPIDEAISTAGGVAWDSIDGKLMLRDIPGVFVAGEMLDWDAPTGGYLINACMATGKWAGKEAAKWGANL